MAMDMHRPDELPPRLDGLQMLAYEYGQDTVKRLTADNPRRLILEG